MIAIDKSAEEPERLQEEGERERAKLEKAYEDDSTDFASVLEERGFNRRIYSHPSVRQALLDCHHEKCCYCEKGREHVHEVEHFRPKTAVRQEQGASKIKPGYYWLAYEWDNLFMACRHCNGRKGTVFPLRNPSNRARSHQDDIGQEEPLLLCPDQDNPTDHLSFRENVVIGKTDRGRESIDVLGLNREALKRDRRERYESLKVMYALSQLDVSQSERAQQKLDRATASDAEFSAMAQEAIDAEFETSWN